MINLWPIAERESANNPEAQARILLGEKNFSRREKYFFLLHIFLFFVQEAWGRGALLAIVLEDVLGILVSKEDGFLQIGAGAFLVALDSQAIA